MNLNRLMTNLLSDDLAESKEFYTSLFGFEVNFDSYWYVHLKHGSLELGIVAKEHQIVPPKARGGCTGHYLTFVVHDLQSLKRAAHEPGYILLQPPHKTDYGQMRMIIKAPEGTICDVSSPM